MHILAQQLFKDLDAGKHQPFYLIAGEEPFQLDEILARFKKHFLKTESDREFNYESWDAEDRDVSDLVQSLDTLPGLFAGDSLRLILARNVEKLNSGDWEKLESYLSNPSESTCLVMVATKLDKRKAYYKRIDEKGHVIEVAEPFDREWPKWLGYFERKVGKRIEPVVWEHLIEFSGRSLSVVWSELQKMATYSGEKPNISVDDLAALSSSSHGADIFNFAEDVVMKRRWNAMKRFHDLLRSGESEIKMLSIVVRQFRLVKHYLDLARKNITDPKVVGGQIGVNPYFISKIATQARSQSPKELETAISLLADCDYKMKTGEGGMFENFLVPYFSRGAG